MYVENGSTIADSRERAIYAIYYGWIWKWRGSLQKFGEEIWTRKNWLCVSNDVFKQESKTKQSYTETVDWVV